MMKTNFERKGLAHLATVIVHAYEFQAFYFFVTLEHFCMEIEDRRAIDSEYFEVVVSIPQELDPEDIVNRWKEWQTEEMLLDYAIYN